MSTTGVKAGVYDTLHVRDINNNLTDILDLVGGGSEDIQALEARATALEAADVVANASISTLQSVTNGLDVAALQNADASNSSAIADLTTSLNTLDDAIEAQADRIDGVEVKNAQQDVAIAAKQDALISLVPPGHTSLLNVGEAGVLVKTITPGNNISLIDHVSHVEFVATGAVDPSNLGDVGCSSLSCAGSATIDGLLTVTNDITCAEIYSLGIRGVALENINTARDQAISTAVNPIDTRLADIETVVTGPSGNGYSYLDLPPNLNSLLVRNNDGDNVFGFSPAEAHAYMTLRVSNPIEGVDTAAPYPKALTYSKSEADALLEDKEPTLLLMPGELQRVLDGSGGQLAFKLGLHSDFLDRIAALEAGSGGGDVAAQIAAEDTITVNGVFQVKHGAIERNGTQPEGGIYMGEGGTGDFAIEMVGMHNNAACYLDMCRLGNDFRMRLIYYLGADYLKIFTQAARSMELRQSGLSANGYSSFSDARLKDEVQSLPQNNCVELVKSVDPKSYVRNDIEGSGRRIGFIAQDLQAAAIGDLSAIIGEADGDNAADHYLTVDYPKLTSILWSVCQNLLARVETLESRA